MNMETTIQPAEQLVQRLVNDAETMARNEPAKAMAVAMGVGVILNVLPTRFLVASVTAVTLTLLRPALLTLGVIKAFELCNNSACPAKSTQSPLILP
jgi:transcription initiation factor TFIIIB Brf1 subunit/transcription initiation factor TFIIB